MSDYIDTVFTDSCDCPEMEALAQARVSLTQAKALSKTHPSEALKSITEDLEEVISTLVQWDALDDKEEGNELHEQKEKLWDDARVMLEDLAAGDGRLNARIEDLNATLEEAQER